MLSDSSDDSDDMSLACKWWLIDNLSTRSRRFSAIPSNQVRQELGEYHHLFSQLKQRPDTFLEYTRMSPETFDYISETISPRLENKTYCNLHTNPVSGEQQLVVTLRYLVTGNSFRALASSFRLGSSTVGQIVKNVCQLLWVTFQPEHMPTPTSSVYQQVEQKYFDLWKFPNCIGALGGKQCKVKYVSNLSTANSKHKRGFSIILQGVVDDRLKFLFIDVGDFGKDSDDGFNTLYFHRLLNENKPNIRNIPGEKCLPHSDSKVPHVFLADESYPLRGNVLRPFGKKRFRDEEELLFNNRLSNARKTVDDAFSILFANWRVLAGCIETSPETADHVVKAACVLHNIVMDREGFSGDLSALPHIPAQCSLRPDGRAMNAHSRMAKEVRDHFKNYFVNNR